MKVLRYVVVPILLSTIWVSLMEFGRNELLLKSNWVDHYASMGLVFPSEPLNGAVWGIWALVFSVVLYLISRRFSLLETFAIGWLSGFVLMWLVTGNMGVLPYSILGIAIPASMIEVLGAVWILQRLGTRPGA